MKEFLDHFIQIIQSYGIAGLIAMSFAESSFFPIPPDVLMIPMSFINRKLSLFYALITTVSSVLGGIFGHIIGRKLGKPILNKFFSKDKINKVENYFNKYGGWAVVIAGFTPIPYKIFTISAGAFGVRMPVFIISSIIGRGGRFFLVGSFIFFLGDTAKYYLNNYFEVITVIVTLILAAAYFAWKKLKSLKLVNGTGAVTGVKKKYNSLYPLINKYKVYDEAAFYFITGIILSLMSLFLFINIVQDYYKLGSFWFDEKIFNYLQSLRSGGLNTFFKMITSIGYPAPVAILTLTVCGFLLRLKKKKESLFFLSNILGVWLFNETLKYVFKRSRPIDSRLIDASGYSFPSGHAMVFMGFSLILIYLMLIHFESRKLAYIISSTIFILAVLVGISRVYLGVHYFSDVIAGWLVGVLWASTSIIVHRTLIHREVSK